MATEAFEGQNDDELSFRKGAKAKVLKNEGDWLEVEIGGNRGFVPATYFDKS